MHAVAGAAVSLARRLSAGSAGRDLSRQSLSKILVLQLQQVGDSIVFTPALRALRKRFPDARIDLLVNRVTLEVHRHSPHVDAFHLDPHTHRGRRRLLPAAEVLRKVRAERYDCVIADAAEQSWKYGLTALATGAPLRVGFDVDGRGALHTHSLPLPDGEDFVTANLMLVALFGADASDRREEFHLSAADRAAARTLLGDVAPSFIALHPGSNWQSKTWFPDRWARVADALADRTRAPIVLVGTEAESPIIEQVRSAMRGPAVSLAGRTSLGELAAVLSLARLFVGTDSGPRHIAGALGIPQVTVMSSQDLAHRWTLARPAEIVLRSDPDCSPCFLSTCSHRRCMDLIDGARVLGACETLLERSRVSVPEPDGGAAQARLAEPRR